MESVTEGAPKLPTQTAPEGGVDEYADEEMEQEDPEYADADADADESRSDGEPMGFEPVASGSGGHSSGGSHGGPSLDKERSVSGDFSEKLHRYLSGRKKETQC